MSSGASSVYLDSLFQATCYSAGAKVGTSALFNFDNTITIAWNDVTKRFDVGVSSGNAVTFAAVNAALATANAAIDVNGAIMQSIGAVKLVNGTLLADAATVTTGTTPVTLMSLSLPSGNGVTIRAGVLAKSGVDFYGSDKIGRLANNGGSLDPLTALADDVMANHDSIVMGGGGMSIAIVGSNLALIWTGKAATTISVKAWMQATTV